MSPVTCFRRILSHDVCKLVIEAARSSLRSVAGEAMGTGKRREGSPLLQLNPEPYYFEVPREMEKSSK